MRRKTLIKGRIGVARRIHYLEAVCRSVRWATSACGKWAGKVDVVPDFESVTCRECARVDFRKAETREE